MQAKQDNAKADELDSPGNVAEETLAELSLTGKNNRKTMLAFLHRSSFPCMFLHDTTRHSKAAGPTDPPSAAETAAWYASFKLAEL